MRFMVRELPQKQYHIQWNEHPKVPKGKTSKKGDRWETERYNYTIDEVEWKNGELMVYATKEKRDYRPHNRRYKCKT